MIYDILLGIMLLAFLVIGLAWRISTKVIMQPRELTKRDWEQYRLNPEWVSFPASDGVKLAGAFLAGTNGATIILLHGYGRSKEQLLPQARFLNQAGYNVLMFDFRASGESEGKYITFGQREQHDLEGAMGYLRQRGGINIQRLGLFGFSMGGAVALMKSGDLPEVKAIVISSAYMRFKSVIWERFQEFLKGIPFFPIGYFVLWIIKYRTGIYYPRITPIKYLRKLNPRPLMVIHGAHDKKIPVYHAMELYRRAPWLEEFWLVRNAAHDNVYAIGKEAYETKVLGFFNRHLLGSERRSG